MLHTPNHHASPFHLEKGRHTLENEAGTFCVCTVICCRPVTVGGPTTKVRTLCDVRWVMGQSGGGEYGGVAQGLSCKSLKAS